MVHHGPVPTKITQIA